MLELVNYGTFRELLNKCKELGLSLREIDNIHNADYECDECKIIVANDDTHVTILIAIHEEDEMGLPTCIQVLNISIRPLI